MLGEVDEYVVVVDVLAVALDPVPPPLPLMMTIEVEITTGIEVVACLVPVIRTSVGVVEEDVVNGIEPVLFVVPMMEFERTDAVPLAVRLLSTDSGIMAALVCVLSVF